MSDDLISRTLLLRKFSITDDGRWIHEYDCDNFPTTINLCSVKTIIRNASTAYNKEKVIEKIKELAEESRKYWSEFDDECAFGEMNAYSKAIDIVEKGGIE